MEVLACNLESKSTNQLPVFVPTAQVNPANTIFNFERTFEKMSRYTETSTIYKLKGGFEAEVIQNPGVKFIERRIFMAVMNELRLVTLKAFGKSMEESATYTPDAVMHKNVMFVDWLIVVRKEGKVIAYTTGSYIDQNVFYTNATMVLPEYQKSNGLGIIPNMFLWKKISDSKHNSNGIKLVCRTRNKNVVSLLSHIWVDMKISADDNISMEDKKSFKYIAEHIDVKYNYHKGITEDVYPGKLPCGDENHHVKEYKEVFEKLSERDGFYVCGQVNLKKINSILRKKIEPISGKGEF